MNPNTPAGLGPVGACLVLAASLTFAACGTGEQLLRQDTQELAACDGTSAAQLGWEQSHWQWSSSEVDGCVTRRAPRCDVQTLSRTTRRYTCR
jgi:hypothetical protein